MALSLAVLALLIQAQPNPGGTRARDLQSQPAPTTQSVVREVRRRSLPPVRWDAPELAFGAAIEGNTLTLDLAVHDRTNLGLSVTALSLAGDAAGDFTLAPMSLPLALAPGASVQLQLGFTPGARGRRAAWLTVETDRGAHGLSLVGVGLGPEGGELRIAAGAGPGSVLVDSQGVSWTNDFGHAGGRLLRQGGPVAGTGDPALYQDQRSGARFRYSWPVPQAGTWRLRLHFAELVEDLPGTRVFDVLAEGTVVLGALDLVQSAGPLAAHVVELDVDVLDGELDLEFRAQRGEAAVAAIEVFSFAELACSPPLLDFGAVEEGETAELAFRLANPSTRTVTIDRLSIELAGSGTPEDFTVLLSGATFEGESVDAGYDVSIVLAPGEFLDGSVRFAPDQERYDAARMVIAGDFDACQVDLRGLGGHAGDPFLHVVIDSAPFVVDRDGDGGEAVTLVGSGSHTHEPGRSLIDFDWSVDDVLVAQGPQASARIDVGSHNVGLRIGDDGSPQRTLEDHVELDVVPATDVPGVLVRYYLDEPLGFAGGGGSGGSGGSRGLALWSPDPFVAELPAADFAEVRDEAGLPQGPTLGGSPFVGDVLVRFDLGLSVPSTGSVEITAVGGSSSGVELDGVTHAGATTVANGRHELEARFVVEDLSDLPLVLYVSFDGGTPVQLAGPSLLHDETSLEPVINVMPALGSELGGNRIEILGLGFFPTGSVQVHFGFTTLGSSDFTEAGEGRLVFLSPPGIGTVTVQVETPAGLSNSRFFDYDPAGPVPIQFANTRTIRVPSPTSAAWGPDGRFYVLALDGRVTAISFDDVWNVLALETYVGVSGLSNHDALGIAFDPFDAPDPVRVFVAHGRHFANGGSSFVGPSPYTGQVSVLTGPLFDTPEPVVTGLPVSNHDHGVNGILFDHNGDLFIGVGSATNAGVAHPNSGDLPESPLSASIVRAWTSRPDFDGAITYRDTSDGTANADQVDGERVELAPGVHVETYATGLRNPFDLVLTTKNRLYATDNGPNRGFGAASTGPTTEDPDPQDKDELVLIERDLWYGHPNRSRARFDPRQYVYRGSGEPDEAGVFRQALIQLPSSSDGIDEYRSDLFGGALRGDLLIQKWISQARRISLTDDGREVVRLDTVFPWTGALSLRSGPAGTILAMDYSNNELEILEPVDPTLSGLRVVDVFPWRSRPEGGWSFTVAGTGFGTLADTSVSFASVPATVTEVGPNRIRGILPPASQPSTSLQDVTVTVGTVSDTLEDAFRYLFGRGREPGWWESLDELPVALGELACGVIDGKLYVVGEGSPRTLVYDLLQSAWIADARARPLPGHHHAAEVVGERLFLIGGLHDGSEGKLQIYDPARDAWSLGAELPWPGGSIATAVIDGKIYAGGGIVGSQTVGDCAVYDPATDAWTPLAPMRKRRNHAAAGTDGERFWVFGGRAFGNFVTNGYPEVQVYDPSTNTWITSDHPSGELIPMPVGRGGTGKAVFQNGEFYVFGGETKTDPDALPGSRVFERVDVYDPLSKSWREEAPMPRARHGMFPILFQSRIYLPGGGIQAGNSQSSVFDVYQRR